MKILKPVMFIIAMCAVALVAPSCKKQEKPPAEKKNTAAQKAPAPKKKTLEQALAGIPCKLDKKIGVFAVFPKNPVAGQWCFTLTPDTGDQSKPGVTFDIQTNDMIVVVHESRKIDPESVTLVKWEQRDGKICTEKECGSAVAARSVLYEDDKDPGWFYLIITPNKQPDLTTGAGGYYGITSSASGKDTVLLPAFN